MNWVLFALATLTVAALVFVAMRITPKSELRRYFVTLTLCFYGLGCFRFALEMLGVWG